MIRYKIDIQKALKRAGYSTYRLIQQNLFFPRELTYIKNGTYMSRKFFNVVCNLLDCQPGDLIEFVFEENTDENLKENMVALREQYLAEERERKENFKYKLPDDNTWKRMVAEPSFYGHYGHRDIKYKENLLDKLKEKGYSTYRLRQEKILGNGEIQKLRNGEVNLGAEFLEKICLILHCQPGDFLEYK